jgi:hypothetical protein
MEEAGNRGGRAPHPHAGEGTTDNEERQAEAKEEEESLLFVPVHEPERPEERQCESKRNRRHKPPPAGLVSWALFLMPGRAVQLPAP